MANVTLRWKMTMIKLCPVHVRVLAELQRAYLNLSQELTDVQLLYHNFTKLHFC